MALNQLNITVGDTPVLIANNNAKVAKVRYYIDNIGSSHGFYLGGPSVTDTTGYFIGKQQASSLNNRFQIDLFAGESIYGVCASGHTTNVVVLSAGNL
jgi:hypothetical protein